MEPASLSLAVFSAFNDAIQCFDYVHLARNFDRDVTTVTLKLDVSQLQLSRWGKSVGLGNGTALKNITASDAELKQAAKLLEHIKRLFDDAQKKSALLQPSGDDDDRSEAVAETDLDPRARTLHRTLKALSLAKSGAAAVAKKARWALYSEKHVRRLVEDISEEVESLVKLFPAAQPELHRLVEEEGRAIAADANARILEPILEEVDADLGKAVKSSYVLGPSNVFNAGNSTNYGQQLNENTGTVTNNFGGKP